MTEKTEVKTFKFALITDKGQWSYIDEHSRFMTMEKSLEDLQLKVWRALSNKTPLTIPRTKKIPRVSLILFGESAIVHIWPWDTWQAAQLPGSTELELGSKVEVKIQ